MPKKQPVRNYQDVRELMEKFEWTDRRTGVRVTGYNPPQGAKDLDRKSVFIRYLTKRGVVEQGQVQCLKVFLDRHQRLIRYVNSGEIRRICDILIIEIDGIRIIAG